MILARVIIFNAVQAAGCLYAFRRGGQPERLTAAMLAAATLASGAAIALLGVHKEHMNPALFAVDAALLLGLVALAARANRFWPMWLAAFQLCALTVHVAYEIEPAVMPGVYNRTIGKIAYPMILLLAIGTYRQQQRRTQLNTGPDWSVLKW